MWSGDAYVRTAAVESVGTKGGAAIATPNVPVRPRSPAVRSYSDPPPNHRGGQACNRPKISESLSACHEASMMLAETPMVVQLR